MAKNVLMACFFVPSGATHDFVQIHKHTVNNPVHLFILRVIINSRPRTGVKRKFQSIRGRARKWASPTLVRWTLPAQQAK